MPPSKSADLTVIIPALNEAANIARCIATTRERLGDAQLIVVDGGSTDQTAAIVRGAGAEVMSSPRGRGVQCDAGARRAASEWLLFLHADTLLPIDAAMMIAEFTARRNARIATFRLRFDDPGMFLRACCWFTRFDSVFTRFGDQGIVIRRDFYHDLGGFPPWPLFEDVALLQRARALTRVVSLPACVTTSARRFQRRGHVQQQWFNARLLFRYLLGASPAVLAEDYRTTATAHDGAMMAATKRQPVPP